MRFGEKKHINQKETRTWFAWWPVRISNETLWLEEVTVEGIWKTKDWADTKWYWEKRKFINGSIKD